MSGRKTPKSAKAGPSAHRFQDRRQERMRGAGTQVAIQRSFQFQLPAAGAAPPAAASTPAKRPRGRPSKARSQGDESTASIHEPGTSRRASATAPISSTPAASRTVRRSPLFRGPSYDNSQSSQIGDDMDYGGGAPDDSMPQIDMSLPMIPSPRRMRPSVGASSVGQITLPDEAEPETERPLRQKHSSKTTASSAAVPRKPAIQKSAPKKVTQRSVPVDYEMDDTVQDRTLMEAPRGIPAVQRRLDKALGLVFATDARKPRKYLNDVDVIWSVVDDELRVAIEEQPAKSAFLALKTLRKAVRANFLAVSERTDARTTLLSHLVRARQEKKRLRQEVFSTRKELHTQTTLANERQKELDGWRSETTDVVRTNNFLRTLETLQF